MFSASGHGFVGVAPAVIGSARSPSAMSLSARDFWRLVIESRLLAPERCQQLNDAFTRTQGAINGVAGRAGHTDGVGAKALARWLVSQTAISRYQAKVLLAGRPGPFVYGDYLIHNRIDGGRLAGLFRARHLPTRHRVLLSFLAGPELEDPQAKARLSQQVQAASAASLDQPNLARTYQWVDLGSYKFVVLEDLQGETAQDRLRSAGKLPPGIACRIVRQVALGLARLHAQGQAHGQIYPGNLWLDNCGQAKLLHFPLTTMSLAGLRSSEPAATDLAAVQADFLAPELAQAAHLPDARSDIYGLGCALYQLLSGQVPFPGAEARARLLRHATETPRSLESISPAVPAALAKLVAYMMHKNPDLRYQQAASVAEALAPFASADESRPPDAKLAARQLAFEAWLRQASLATHRMAASVQPVAPVGAGAAAPAAAPTLAAPAVFAVAPQMSAAEPMAASVQAWAAAPLPLVTAPATSAVEVLRARRGGRGSRQSFAVAAAGVVLIAGVVAAVAFLPRARGPATAPSAGGTDSPIADRGNSGGAKESTSDSGSLPANVKSSGTEGVQSADTVQGMDEEIWQSPTAGKPLDLAFMAPGVQAIVAVRPSALVQHAEWEKLSDPRTSGSLGSWVTGELPRLSGTSLNNIELALVGWLDASPDPPLIAAVVQTISAVPRADLLAAWGNPPPESLNGQTIYIDAARGISFYLPEADGGTLIVTAPVEEMREIVASNGQRPALRRELENLLATSDADRTFTALFAPNFLFTGGQALFSGPAARLRNPLEALLTLDDVDGRLELPKAALVSIHLDDRLFLELRIHNSFAGRPLSIVAREFRRRAARLPNQVNAYVRDLFLSPYSKAVLWEFPRQMEILDRYMRAGTDGKQVVLRAYLPEMAAHNLALGAHLSLLEEAGTAAVVASEPAARPQTVAERLKMKTTLSFPKNTLEVALQLLGEDLGVAFVIVGPDLEQEGITKNQSFAIDEHDQPADAILRKIMIQANPAGKLIYVIKPKEVGGEDAVYITTRAAAAKRGDKLPPELEQNQ